MTAMEVMFVAAKCRLLLLTFQSKARMTDIYAYLTKRAFKHDVSNRCRCRRPQKR